MIDRDLVCYLAGFFDGEGCLNVARVTDPKYRAGYHLTLRASLSSSNDRPLLRAQAVFGGCICTQKPHGLSRRLSYTWTLYGDRAKSFLSALEPHLIVKRQAAQLAVSFPIRHGGFRLDEDVQAAIVGRQAEVRAALQQLSQKGSCRQ